MVSAITNSTSKRKHPRYVRPNMETSVWHDTRLFKSLKRSYVEHQFPCHYVLLCKFSLLQSARSKWHQNPLMQNMYWTSRKLVVLLQRSIIQQRLNRSSGFVFLQVIESLIQTGLKIDNWMSYNLKVHIHTNTQRKHKGEWR